MTIFVGITAFLWFLIYCHCVDKDEKKHDKERRELAEYFYKVILNNILTGISFMKRAWNKRKEYDKKTLLIDCLDIKQNDYKEIKNTYLDSQKYYLKEIKLYISEALFYFKTADKQFEKKKIFENGMRKEYIEFIDIVGVSTLKNVFDMYNQSYNNLKELSDLMDDNDNQSDIDDIGEFLVSKKLDLKKIEKMYLQKKNKNH